MNTLWPFHSYVKQRREKRKCWNDLIELDNRKMIANSGLVCIPYVSVRKRNRERELKIKNVLL